MVETLFDTHCDPAADWVEDSEVLGCVEFDGEIQTSSEACPNPSAPSYCLEGVSQRCEVSDRAVGLLFTEDCGVQRRCQVNDEGKAYCGEQYVPYTSNALLLFTSHQLRVNGEFVWAPAHIPRTARVEIPRHAVVVVMVDDRIRAYRGGSVQLDEGESTAIRPRPEFVRYLRSADADVALRELIHAEARLAIDHQVHYSHPPAELDAVIEAGLHWHERDPLLASVTLDNAMHDLVETEAIEEARARIVESQRNRH